MSNLRTIVDSGFRDTVLREPTPTLVLYSSKWNPACAPLLPIFEELAEELAGRVNVGVADGDTQAEIDAWFRIIDFPTAVLYKDGQEIGRLCGPRSRQEYLSFVEGLLFASPVRDTMPDTWVAMDQLGRTLPTHEQVGSPRSDRTVMMFYFINLPHNPEDPAQRQGPFDNTKILAANPGAIDDPSSPPWGPYGSVHHWGESQFGYYLNTDEYVIAKHAQQLTDAGVDTLVYDVSNYNDLRDPEHPRGYNYDSFMAIFRVFDRLCKAGRKTPKVCFLLNFWSGPYGVRRLYKDVYEKGLYRDLWFMWDHKPLVMYDPAKLGPEDAHLREFFTFRRPMPDYFYGPKGPDQWAWCEIHPQHAFYSAEEPDRPEEVPVSVAQNAVPDAHTEGGWTLGNMSQRDENGHFVARGRSFHDGVQPAEYHPAEGANFQEEWDRALKLDPKLVFITGWNEWIMGRMPQFIHYKAANVMVDQFDEEFSRDIEPSRTEIRDTAYYQFAANVRRYKGARPIPHTYGQRTIDLAGSFDQWQDVAPDYLDDVGDIESRDCEGWGNAGVYRADTGRNDLDTMRVTCDAQKVYFYVKTAQPITSYTDPNWMQLLLRVDRDAQPASLLGTAKKLFTQASPDWNGFQYLIGRTDTGSGTMQLEKSKGGFDWEPVARVTYRCEGCELMLSVERKWLGLPEGAFSLDFKWCDNIALGSDEFGLEFCTQGDTAPNGRFMYRYING